GALLPGRGGRLSAPEQGPLSVAHAPGRVVAPSHPHARDGQPNHQRAALPAPGGIWLSGHGDGAGGLGAQPEERIDLGAPYRSEKAQRRRAPGGAPGRIRPARKPRGPLRPDCLTTAGSSAPSFNWNLTPIFLLGSDSHFRLPWPLFASDPRAHAMARLPRLT